MSTCTDDKSWAAGDLNCLSPPHNWGAAQLKIKLVRIEKNPLRRCYYKKYPKNTNIRGFCSSLMLQELSMQNTIVYRDGRYILNPTEE